MIPIRFFAMSAALAALAACTTETSSDAGAVDLSHKAKVVTFDVSGMT
ncbi:MAG: hypothetical protein R3F49_04180 [Planctomycetota bacterium]